MHCDLDYSVDARGARVLYARVFPVSFKFIIIFWRTRTLRTREFVHMYLNNKIFSQKSENKKKPTIGWRRLGHLKWHMTHLGRLVIKSFRHKCLSLQRILLQLAFSVKINLKKQHKKEIWNRADKYERSYWAYKNLVKIKSGIATSITN